MNVQRYLSPIACTLIFFSIVSCSFPQHFKENYQASLENYPTPEQLSGSPENSGLMIVDAVTEKALNSMPISGASIVNLLEPEAMITAGSFKQGGLFSDLSGVVVFSNLKPGNYRIVKIKTQNANMWEVLSLPNSKEFEIEVVEGKVSYLGQIKIKHPFATTKREISLEYQASRESEALNITVTKFNQSSWAPIIQTQMAGIDR